MKCLIPMLLLAMIFVISATPVKRDSDSEYPVGASDTAAAPGDDAAAVPGGADASGEAGASGADTSAADASAAAPADTSAAADASAAAPPADTSAPADTAAPSADAAAEVPAADAAAETPAEPATPAAATETETPSQPAETPEAPTDNAAAETPSDNGAASMMASDLEVIARTICKPGCGVGEAVFKAKAYLVSNVMREHDTVPGVDFNVRKLVTKHFAMWKKAREGNAIFTSTHDITRPSFPMCQDLAQRVIQRSLNFADPTNSATHFKLWTQELQDAHPEGTKINKCYFF